TPGAAEARLPDPARPSTLPASASGAAADLRTSRLCGDCRVVIGPGIPRLVIAVRDGRQAGRGADGDAEVVEQVPIAGARHSALARPAEVDDRAGRDLRELAAGHGGVAVLREE